MNRNETIEKIIEYFNNNEEVFNAAIEELDGYNGWLNGDRYYGMECLTEFYAGADPIELLNRAYFGRDDDTWTTDSSGNRTYGSFDPNRNYFYYNGYGNFVSSDFKDYTGYIDVYTVEAMSENRQYIDTISDNNYFELCVLFDELEMEG